MCLVADDLRGNLEEAVRRDPQVQQARKIAEAARTRLLACVAGPDDDGDLAEAQRMMDALRKATVLAQDAEDRVRVHLGLLTQDEADRRATARRASLPDRGVPLGTLPLGGVRAVTPTPGRTPRPFAVLPKNPALAVLLSLFVPGLGSAVSGELISGTLLFICAAIPAGMAAALLGAARPVDGWAIPLLISAAVWLTSLAAAYHAARLWNTRHGIES